MIYFLTILNATILGIVAYLFYTFRKAVESSGVKQIDDYLHELEGSVGQLTAQFERSSTKISKDLLRKTTELQALIGECDTKLAEMNRLRMGTSVTPADILAGRPARPAQTRPSPVAGVPSVPPAVAARALSASGALAERVKSSANGTSHLADGAYGGGSDAASPASGTSGDSGRRARGARREPSAAEAEGTVSVVLADQGAELLSLARIEQEAESGSELPVAAGVGQPNEKYRLIFLLASEGMDSASIAKHTNLTRGEVEMLLDLRRQGKI